MNESVTILLALRLSIVINQRSEAIHNILPQVYLLEYHERDLINREYLHPDLRHRASILSPLPADNKQIRSITQPNNRLELETLKQLEPEIVYQLPL